MATVTLRGKSIRTSGDLPSTGQPAPDFMLVDQRLDDKTLADFTGRRKLLYIVPSVDTPVCAASAKQFSERLAEADGTAALLISADLPFA
ncbi:MAG TPA: redoxin domain-containing protein, partial [Gammaproteobacteria bacterium]|nr:redoxin domain-containing protein [Gammaproteobacteria bacterium]